MDPARATTIKRLGLISGSLIPPCAASRPQAQYTLKRSFATTLPQYWLRDHPEGRDIRAEWAQKDPISRRVHILGLGNIGIFVAHSLATLPHPPPMTLHLRHDKMYEAWKKGRGKLTVMKQGLPQTKSGFDINLLRDDVWFKHSEDVTAETAIEDIRAPPGEEDNSTIDNLILTVKATQVEPALMSVRHRLTSRSTIVFLQNGMGVQDVVNEKVFPDPATRPSYICGVISHGLYRTKPFEVTHAGVGTTTLGIVQSNLEAKPATSDPPPEEDELQQGQQEESPELTADGSKAPLNYWGGTSRYLLALLTKTHALVATKVNKTTLLQYQLEKLAMNAVINPLTVIMDCTNGDLLYNFYNSRVQRLLLIEISTVIRALPELQGLPGVDARFGPERLRTRAVAIMKQTAENTSSMLQDVRAGKQTEIKFINGYIVRRGEELGIKCALNYMMMQLILAKTKFEHTAKGKHIPLEMPGQE